MECSTFSLKSLRDCKHQTNIFCCVIQLFYFLTKWMIYMYSIESVKCKTSATQTFWNVKIMEWDLLKLEILLNCFPFEYQTTHYVYNANHFIFKLISMSGKPLKSHKRFFNKFISACWASNDTLYWFNIPCRDVLFLLNFINDFSDLV